MVRDVSQSTCLNNLVCCPTPIFICADLLHDQADNFVNDFVRFAHGKVIADDKQADAGEIGRAGETYRRIRISSLFGNVQVLVTDDHLPYPFAHEVTGYQVQDLKAKALSNRARR